MNKSTHKKHNIVPIRHLKKTQISHRGGGTKYYVDCSAYAANPEVFEIETMLRNTNHIAILKAVLHANEPTIHDKKKVVIKIGRSNAITKNEFVIGEQLYQERLLGFIKYVCLFTCYDDTSERYTEITATGISEHVSGKICGADPSKTNQKDVLVMPYIPLGSVENHQWGESDVSLVKSLVMQVLVSLAVAYDTIGFIHGDMHLGNILFKTTKSTAIRYTSPTLGDISVPTLGHKIVLMDFEKSEIYAKKNKDTLKLFWADINTVLNRMNSLPVNHGYTMTWFIGDILNKVQESKKQNISCTRDVILELFTMIEHSDMIFEQITRVRYDPNVYG